VVVAAVKTVVTNRIMTGSLKLSPLEVLFRMSPLAFIQALIYSYISGELAALNISLTSLVSSTSIAQILLNRRTALASLGNGFLAFVMNIASFSANKTRAH
jgi:hypothetical protein